MNTADAIWETPTGQTIAESNGVLVHIDAQGFVPPLPDAHSVSFPVLTFPSSAIDSTSTRHTSDPVPSPTRFATVEIFLHRLLALSSIPVDLFIPPYSTPLSPTHIPLQSARIGRIALHPEIPIVALAQAHSGGSIFLFDLRTNAYLKYKLALADNHQLNALVFSKYNLLAAGTSTGDILLFELNLSVPASTASKPIQLAAIPSLAALIPPQFPSFALLGEVTDLNFDHRTGRYLAIATTRSGTWIYDTVYSSSLRLSKYPSSSVAFSPTEDVLAVARERTGDIEFYTVVRAGTLTFSKPMVAKSGFKTTVTRIQWASNGKSLLYCNDGVESIRILNIEGQPLLPPVASYLGSIDTPLRATPVAGVPYGGFPRGFVLDKSSRRLVVSYSKSPLLEVFVLSNIANPANATSLGVIRGPSSGKLISEKAKGKRPEGQSPFEEDSWARGICVDMGFVGQALGDKGSLFVGGWNGEDSGKLAFVAFHLEDINV